MNILVSAISLLVIVMLGVVQFRSRFPYHLRLAAAVVFWTLLLTPVLVPVTIVVFPAPFVLVLALGIFRGAMHEVIELLVLFWKWHVISFMVTAATVYFFSRKVLSNPALNTDAERPQRAG